MSQGRTRLNRLTSIASHSTVLAVDALKLAAREVVDHGRDVQLYRNVIEDLRAIDPTDSAAVYDAQWAEKTDKANKAELSRLEGELKGYKNNLVKESIRVRDDQSPRSVFILALTMRRWETRT